MSVLTKIPSRMPVVPHRRLALTEEQARLQRQRGLYTVHRGEAVPIPFDHHTRPQVFLDRELWRQDSVHGIYRPGVKFHPPGTHVQKRVLTWLRDHVHQDIPYWYYLAVLGHDLHVSTWGDLYAKHWHVGWTNPFNPEQMDEPLDRSQDGLLGFTENLGWLSGGKVSDAFVSEEIDELVSTTSTEYADFDFHEVGTSTQAENNNDTALIATSGITRVTGTPTDSDPIYQNVATITADATESWEEHGLFNNSSGATLMDRSLTGGQSVDSGHQVTYTYQLTKNPEA